jgi:hypothetical protein
MSALLSIAASGVLVALSVWLLAGVVLASAGSCSSPAD